MTYSRLLVFIVLFIASFISANAQSQATAFYCPPCDSDCDQLTFTEAGECPHCGMSLLEQTAEERIQSLRPIRIAFYLQDGVEVLDFAGPMEVFSYAGFDVFTVSKTKKPIQSQGILNIIPDYNIKNAPAADILAFFGGNGANSANDEAVIEWIQGQSPDYHFSVCTGAFFLAEAGILDGLTATTFHSAIDHLRTGFPAITVLDNARFVDNGTVITTAGISAGIDGALYLVEKLRGSAVAEAVVVYMEYDKWVRGEGVIID